MTLTAAESAALAVDRPFAPPIECVMDLPFPPSSNRLWRADGKVKLNGKLIDRPVVRRSDDYKSWIKQAHTAVIANGTWRHRQRMPALFAAEILLDRGQRRGRSDVDNRIKAVLDWAQKVGLVKDDQLCEDVRARWVNAPEAPTGCRLILRSVTL